MAKIAKKTKKLKPDAIVLIGVQCDHGHRNVVGADNLNIYTKYPEEGIYVVWYCHECPLNTRKEQKVRVGF